MRAYALALLLGAGAVSAARADDPAFGGTQVYDHVCQGCHMPDGHGAAGAGRFPSLAGNPALVSWQYVALTVLNGKNGMPAFGEPKDHVTEFGAVHLSDARIAEAVNYVRTHFGNHWKDKVTASQVAALPHPGPAPAP
jgi:mono/diheme cytochrome c family protein